MRVPYQPYKQTELSLVISYEKVYAENLNKIGSSKIGFLKGIGRGIAVQLGEAGATVYITGRSVDKLKECAAEIQKRGGKVPIKSSYIFLLLIYGLQN